MGASSHARRREPVIRDLRSEDLPSIVELAVKEFGVEDGNVFERWEVSQGNTCPFDSRQERASGLGSGLSLLSDVRPGLQVWSLRWIVFYGFSIRLSYPDPTDHKVRDPRFGFARSCRS
jgi:hypothetical protein